MLIHTHTYTHTHTQSLQEELLSLAKAYIASPNPNALAADFMYVLRIEHA